MCGYPIATKRPHCNKPRRMVSCGQGVIYMRFYVGTYSVPGSPGIALCEMKDGRMTQLANTEALRNPTYVILDRARQHLFAVGLDREGNGVAACFAVDDKQFELLATAPTGEGNACHLALDQVERTLYTANYPKGNLAVFSVDAGGAAMERIQLISHQGSGAHPTRQERPHVHHCAFRPGTDELFVCDLGIDRIVTYTADPANGKVTQKSMIPAPGGTGPRHLVFRDANSFYLAGELNSTVLAYALEKGEWVLKQVLSTLPEGDYPDSTTAAIRLSGNKLYVSNRGADNLAAFDVDQAGVLTPAGHIPCHGQSPRDFVVTDFGFLCANQISGTVTVVAPDGTLLGTLAVPGAVCICPM